MSNPHNRFQHVLLGIDAGLHTATMSFVSPTSEIVPLTAGSCLCVRWSSLSPFLRIYSVEVSLLFTFTFPHAIELIQYLASCPPNSFVRVSMSFLPSHRPFVLDV